MSTSTSTPLPPSPPETLQQFLRFQLPGNIQAMVDTQYLAEILNLNLSQVVPISGTNPVMMGVCNWRGEVLWLADLGCLLGFQPLYVQNLRKGQVNTIVARHEGRTLGLGVELVDRMLWCDRDRIQPDFKQPSHSPRLEPYVQGYWADLKEGGWVLDIEAIMNSLQ
ncbi:chemotaxis protein CheW [Altericista sp. CCNU0014]|uniref:chemotaxis protein CheW n=1 Tax=Altericista sp. CCNU0014 TaxID=3082949 RepID=UPI003850CA8F